MMFNIFLNCRQGWGEGLKKEEPSEPRKNRVRNRQGRGRPLTYWWKGGGLGQKKIGTTKGE